jgi:hypothetical protein
MPARLASVLVVAGVVAYVLAPGHPLSLLRGIPLDWLGLVALVGLGCLRFAFGLPRLPLSIARPWGGGAAEDVGAADATGTPAGTSSEGRWSRRASGGPVGGVIPAAQRAHAGDERARVRAPLRNGYSPLPRTAEGLGEGATFTP